MAEIGLQSVNQQFVGFFGKLTRAQRMLIIGVAVLSVVGISALLFATGKPQMSVLFSDLSDKDLSLVVEKLKERKIEYELSDKGKTVLVSSNVMYETRLAMASEGLPQNSTVGYEIFDKTNLGMSDFVQKLNYRRALEGELSRTIMTLEEVDKARVHIVIPEKVLFEKDQKKPSASAVLQLKSGKHVSKGNIEGIQHLIASSIEGMEATSVTVIDQRGQVLSEAVKDPNSLAGLSSTQYELKQKVDDYLTAKAQSLMDGVIGSGNAVVRINADLDFTQMEKTIEDFDPDKQVVRSEQVITNKSQSQDSLSYPAVNQATQNGNTITNYEITKTLEKIVGGTGGVKRLSIAALVNGTTKMVKNPQGESAPQYTPRTQEEIKQFEQIIRNSVGYDPARNDQISVVNIPFDTSVPEEEIKPKILMLGLQWTMQEVIEKGLIVLAMLIAIFMIRRIISSPQVRRRIEQVLAPSDLEKQRLELARTAAERQQLLLKTLTEESSVPLLSESTSADQFASKTKNRLDLIGSEEGGEENILRQEMKHRVQTYISQKPDEATRILKAFLRQVPTAG